MREGQRHGRKIAVKKGNDDTEDRGTERTKTLDTRIVPIKTEWIGKLRVDKKITVHHVTGISHDRLNYNATNTKPSKCTKTRHTHTHTYTRYICMYRDRHDGLLYYVCKYLYVRMCNKA